MAQQFIDNGSFDNDPDAEKIRLAFGKTNDNFTELYGNIGGDGKVSERIIPYLESGESELVEVANSVNAYPSLIVPAKTVQIVSFLEYYGGPLTPYFKKRSYIIKKGQGSYGASGDELTSSDFFILAPVVSDISGFTTIDLGDIGEANIWDYVNASGPYIIEGTTLFETTDGVYAFSGANGTYGVGFLQTNSTNFLPLNESPSHGWEKIHNLSLVGIATEGVDELTYIANAVFEYGPFTCEPDQQIILRTSTPYDEGIIERYYAVIPRVTTIGGNVGGIGGNVSPSFFRPDGQSISETIPSDIIIELGDIGTTAIEDAFNVGDGGDPWDMSVKRFIRATYDGDVTLWSWQGEDGEFGGSGTPATADDFFLITGEPSIPITSQNNVITTIPVLDTDLTTLDAAGLATYFNALDPGVLKQGYESWRIVIVDSGDAIVKTFDLVDRGKGPVGLEAIAENIGNTLTAEMFFEINKGELTPDELAAINGAASPSASNVFATMDDLVASGDISSLKWSAFGDSTSSNGTPNLVDKVSTLLGLTGTNNNAVAGNRIDQQIAILDSLLAGDAAYFTNYDICSMLIGANDYNQDVVMGTRYDATGASTVAGQMKDWIEKVLTSNPAIQLYIITIWERDDRYRTKNNATIPWALEDLSQLFNEIAFDNKIQIIDLNKISGINEFTFSTYISATVHLNTAGTNHVGAIIANAFKNPNNTPVSFERTKQIIKTGNFTVSPIYNETTVSVNGNNVTIDPNQNYPDSFVVALKNIHDSTDGSLILVGLDGWSFKLNNEASVTLTTAGGNETISFPAGATCTIIKFAGSNKFYIDGLE